MSCFLYLAPNGQTILILKYLQHSSLQCFLHRCVADHLLDFGCHRLSLIHTSYCL